MNDEDLQYLEETNSQFPFENKKELLTRKTGDHALILMSASRPKMFMKDKDICKDILKDVTTKNSVYAYRPVQGK